MKDLSIVKLSDSHIEVPHGTVVHANSRYSVTVTAEEFAAHRGDSARLDVVKNGMAVATCELLVDPLRRSVRNGTLAVGGVPGDAVLYAVLGDSVLFTHPVRIAGVSGASALPEQYGRWTVVDLGTVTSGSVTVADLQQVKLSAGTVQGDLSVTAPAVPFEAYVAITGTSDAFPFTGILVNGSAPFWEHMDSLDLAESSWVLHLVNVAGTVHASLHAGVPSGTELDPDGDHVTSTGVNE